MRRIVSLIHDLQEDPTDLPENKRNVWCDYNYGYGKGFYDKDEGGWWIEGHLFCSVINAWCEILTFDKDKTCGSYEPDYEGYIADLEKKNAKLKEKLEHRNCVDCSNHHSNIKLIKAKEILREYIRINLLPPIERNFDDEVKLFKQAEQFLKGE